jgi:hypothetical protein
MDFLDFIMEIRMYAVKQLFRAVKAKKIRFDYLISNEISKSQHYTAESERKKEKEGEREKR